MFELYSQHEQALRVRALLEDFELIYVLGYSALIPKGELYSDLRSNVQAAVLATGLGLTSVDYVRKTYLKGERKADSEYKEDLLREKYNRAYQDAKNYIYNMTTKLVTEGRDEPTVGVFGASLVLEKLSSSFFSAHLLYKLGQKHEAHAVSRMILEQLAWAYAAHGTDDMNIIKRLKPTKCIHELRQLDSRYGKLYGYLSKKVHLDHSNHYDIFETEHGKNIVIHARPDFFEYGLTILTLADLFGIVWEISQANFLDKYEAITFSNGVPIVNEGREFLKLIERYTQEIDQLNANSQS
ncbi:MAG: hypothetical protein H6641_20870 [Caldilineaceae bacterium]|nr:hypothetical protein [Caldilineaceae bacterium]